MIFDDDSINAAADEVGGEDFARAFLAVLIGIAVIFALFAL